MIRCARGASGKTKNLVFRSFKKTLCLVLFELERDHRDDEEERDPWDGGDEAHVHLELHEAPAAGKDRAEGWCR